MFKSLDTLVAFVTIMLMLSMAVTVITQAITGVFNSRGRHLKRGVQDMLRLLDPQLPATMSAAVANAVLTHPLTSGSSWLSPAATGGSGNALARFARWGLGPRLGTVISREELTKILMHFASTAGAADVTPAISQRLKTILTTHGIADPDATLSRIRTRTLEIERLQPELGQALRHSTAVLHEAASEYVAKINASFDQTMDRVSQRFTASTRSVTLAGAVIVAVTFQVDALSVINRLSADEKMREAFVAQATAMQSESQKREAATPAATPGTPPSASSSNAELDRKYRSFLATNGVIALPSKDEWRTSWRSVNPFGVILTIMLLSLGAPFWYKALGQLLNLRSLLAAKDDSAREARQAGPRAAAERGDPSALG